jgi:transcriptional regulator with XRE-family HTH domain
MRTGLTQPELAALLGITESALSKFETEARKPTPNLMVGMEVLFGKSAREAFPAFYAHAERQIMKRACSFSERWEALPKSESDLRLRLVREVIERSEPNNKHL